MSIDTNVTKTGYVPIGIVGWRLDAVEKAAVIYASFINASTARLRILSTHTASQTIPDGSITILYKAT